MDNQNSFGQNSNINQSQESNINTNPAPQKQHGHKKSLIIATIIVILAIGAFYYMQSVSNEIQTLEINDQIQLQDGQVDILNQQNTSDEPVDILNDLQSADIESLDLNLE